VSGAHAKIVVIGDGCFLLDLESMNGTLVDGQRIESGVALPLGGGERICVGGYELVYLAHQHRYVPTGNTVDHPQVLPPSRADVRKRQMIGAVTLAVCIAALASIVLARLF